MTHIQIRSLCAHIGPRNTREGKTSVRKSTLKTWNSALELILLILKMVSGYPLATFLHDRYTANRSRTMFTWWRACPNVVAFIRAVTAFIPAYKCMPSHFCVPIKIPVTLSEHCNHSARFKNTMIELLRTSTDPQISKGVDALKLLSLKKRKIQFSLAVPASKNACALNPLLWPGWNRHLVNSTAPRGQHVSKCALNPRYFPICRGGRGSGVGGRGFNWLMNNSSYHTKPNPIMHQNCLCFLDQC